MIVPILVLLFLWIVWTWIVYKISPRWKKKESTCETCDSERVMFPPDNQQPCRTLVDALKAGLGQAPQPCRLPSGDVRCRFYHGWSDEEPCTLGELLRTFSSAERRIYLSMYVFTNEMLGNLLKYLKRVRKVDVFILTDCKSKQQLENDQIPSLERAGIEIRWDRGAMMHNKYCIVDERVMVSGSVNWTYSFKNNTEMIMWTENERIIGQVVEKFVECFNAGATRQNFVETV